jgi:hypothetical protein
MARRASFVVNYIGGHPARPRPQKNCALIADDRGLHLKYMLAAVLDIPWSDVVHMDFEGSDSPTSRVTMTRLVALNVFAFAAKKRTGEAFLYVATRGGEAGFVVPKMSTGELRVKLGPWTPHRPPIAQVAPPPAPGYRTSIADELAKLAQLRDQGVLTPTEFEAQKARLLR